MRVQIPRPNGALWLVQKVTALHPLLAAASDENQIIGLPAFTLKTRFLYTKVTKKLDDRSAEIVENKRLFVRSQIL